MSEEHYIWTPISVEGVAYKENFSEPLKLLPGKKLLVSADIFAEAVTDFYRLQILGVVALCPEHRFLIMTRFPVAAKHFMEDLHWTNPYNRSEGGEGWTACGVVGDMVSDRAGRYLAGYVPGRLLLGRCGFEKARLFKWPLPNLVIQHV